jgi:glutamate--cysteine ligase
MPSPTRCITTRDVRRFVDEHVFGSIPGEHPVTHGRVGIELEYVTRAHGGAPVATIDEMAAVVGASLPGGSRLTFEPGGQLELSGPALPGLGPATAAMADDVRAARAALAPLGIDLVGIGLDPSGPRPRVLDAGRYAAMEAYFDTRWPDGRTMMRHTASVQVNLDLGPAALVEARWARAHDVLPVLAATFANSPFDASGTPTGWRSTRLAVWNRIDPRRTRWVARAGVSAATSWNSFALDAPVMLIRTDDGECVPSLRSLTFARWIHDGHELGWPTLDDFAYHLTTLFPPVRPRGWLELRAIDSLPDEWWPVAAAVTTALLDDPEAADVASRVTPALGNRWRDAARYACAQPTIGAAAERCFAAALPALPRIGADRATIAAAETYYERFVARGRCPADDLHPDPSRVAVT